MAYPTILNQLIFGESSLKRLPALLNKFSFESIFLVSGKHSFIQPDIQEVVQPLFQQYACVQFSDFSKNLQIEDIEKGVDAYQSLQKPLIIAIGGGSVLDMGKLLHYFGRTGSNPRTFFRQKHMPQIIPSERGLIAIPTTAGTGSESTQFATLYIDKNKYSLDTIFILPDLAIVDPKLTMSLPAIITAESGMDALTQAVESYWNIHATTKSQKIAADAMRSIYPNLRQAVRDPSLLVRKKMALGANLAGRVINITRTTVCHAISYPMTSWFNVRHGQAVSLSVPAMMAFNSHVSQNDVLDPRGVEYVQKTLQDICRILGHESISSFQAGWFSLMRDIGLKTTLADLNIQRSDWQIIIKHGFNPQRVKKNPRLLTESQLWQQLESFEK